MREPDIGRNRALHAPVCSAANPRQSDRMANDSDAVWKKAHLVWKDPATWYGRLTTWLSPRLKPRGLTRLENLGEQDLCWDDLDWREVVLAPELMEREEYVRDCLADALWHATARVFHGCRVNDAGVFHREGLRANDPATMEAMVRRIVEEEEDLAWMRPNIDQRLAEFDARERDTGKVYVCLDDRPQLDYIGHYALYGPEWLQAFFSFSGFRVLRSRGVPTILELDLPLELTSDHIRQELATDLLQEWTRITVNHPTWTPQIDFTISLRHELSAEYVVGHYHPKALKCPYHQNMVVRTAVTECPSCRPSGLKSGV